MVNNLYKMFLGDSPDWYKNTIIAFLIINPITLFVLSSVGIKATFIVGWMILLEFIFTLALALKCYPLQPGGLITIQALFLGLTTPYTLLYEIEHNLEVIKTADWIVDLGPEGGEGGGEIIAQGTPEQIANTTSSHTGRFLKPILNKENNVLDVA